MAWSRGAGNLASFVGYVPANMNMLPWDGEYAQATNFASAQYTLTRSSITTGISAPDGSHNAQKLVENSAAGTHLVVSASAPQTSTQTPIPYRLAVIAKAAERTRLVMFWQNFQDAAATISCGFDLAGGNAGYDNSVGANSTLVSTAMTSLGGGYWLCTMDCQYNVLTAGGTSLVWQPQINLDSGSGTAARSISYTGNGSSGLNLLWFSLLPTAAWSINNPAFSDDFTSLSTIDVGNTKAAGFKWYTNNLWSSSFMPTFGWATNPPSAPTPAGNLSISSPSVLKIYNPNSAANGFTSQIWSTAPDGAGGYVGYAHQPPLAYDGYFNWDGRQSQFSPNWTGFPAFWSMPTEALTNTGMSPTSHFVEWDVTEGFNNSSETKSGTSTKHDWSNPASPVDAKLGVSLNYTMLPGVFLRISGIWLTPASTGTAFGLFLTFINGQFIAFSDRAYSASLGSQPGNTVGLMSGSDNHHMNVIMDTAENGTVNAGGGCAMYIDWVKVFTT